MRESRGLFAVGISLGTALLVSACATASVHQSRAPTTSSVPTASVSTPPTVAPTPAQTDASSSASPAATFGPDVTALTAGQHAAHVMGSGNYPTFTVVVPDGWYDQKGRFVVKYPDTDQPRPVLGLSAWDVGLVFRDPCHWQGQGFDPGPTIDQLVAALVAQTMRAPTRPAEVTLAGYSGRYLALSVPADLKSSTWTDFDACDLDSNGHRDFNRWLGNGMGNRYEQVPGQVDRLWVLDVKGQRLVVDATYSPDTTTTERMELESIVASLRFTP